MSYTRNRGIFRRSGAIRQVERAVVRKASQRGSLPSGRPLPQRHPELSAQERNGPISRDVLPVFLRGTPGSGSATAATHLLFSRVRAY